MTEVKVHSLNSDLNKFSIKFKISEWALCSLTLFDMGYLNCQPWGHHAVEITSLLLFQ